MTSIVPCPITHTRSKFKSYSKNPPGGPTTKATRLFQFNSIQYHTISGSQSLLRFEIVIRFPETSANAAKPARAYYFTSRGIMQHLHSRATRCCFCCFCCDCPPLTPSSSCLPLMAFSNFFFAVVVVVVVLSRGQTASKLFGMLLLFLLPLLLVVGLSVCVSTVRVH